MISDATPKPLKAKTKMAAPQLMAHQLGKPWPAPCAPADRLHFAPRQTPRGGIRAAGRGGISVTPFGISRQIGGLECARNL